MLSLLCVSPYDMSMETISDREPSVIGQLRALGLPEGQVMVMGSGILGALGIREARDIDMVVSEEVYQRQLAQGWQERSFKSGDIESKWGSRTVFFRYLGIGWMTMGFAKILMHCWFRRMLSMA